jgi:hypothetical protein
LSTQKNRKIGRFEAVVHEGGLMLQQQTGQTGGANVELTSDETTQLLELLYQNRRIAPQAADRTALDIPQDPSDDLITSFAYQRAL